METRNLRPRDSRTKRVKKEECIEKQECIGKEEYIEMNSSRNESSTIDREVASISKYKGWYTIGPYRPPLY